MLMDLDEGEYDEEGEDVYYDEEDEDGDEEDGFDEDGFGMSSSNNA